ncbi:MAG: hypothetical protein FJX74_22375, partial [Armatimonadetes bacterium]|nr:hypothetical protein [Armatimonadota bacterium]
MDDAPAPEPSPNRPLRWAIPLAAAIALAGTADMIFREEVRVLYEPNGDIQSILRHAEEAGPGDVLSWWTGVWIERDSPYYRPLASMLMYAEYLAFGRAWRPFCMVSWLMHAGICVLMLLFLARLFDGWAPPWRVLPGLLAVAWFSIPCETTVDGPHWGNRGIARGLMPYWPAQTDLGCLLLSLLSLLLWDRWLRKSGTGTNFPRDVCGELVPVPDFRGLVPVLALFVAALLFKEHAVVLPLLAAGLAVHRRSSWKLAGLTAGVGLGVSGGFLLLRGLLAPEAWSPEYKSLEHVLTKVVVYLCEPAVTAVYNGHGWLILSGVLAAACVGLALYYPRRLYLHGFGLFLGIFLPP